MPEPNFNADSGRQAQDSVEVGNQNSFSKMIKLVSYATGRFTESQAILSASALKHGAHCVSEWSREDIIQTPFYRGVKSLLDVERGAGYWIWKPYLIREELQALAEGDILIYSDTGRPDSPYKIDSPLSIVANWCVEHAGGMLPGIYIPEHGPNERWTKGECFEVMGCNSTIYRKHPQIQATYSVWQRHQRSLDFVSRWLEWCTVPSAIADEQVDSSIPNDPNFIEHRHDQSILTLLALKDGLKCFGRPDQETPFGKNISSLSDRIGKRKWSMRRRFIDYDLKFRYKQPVGTGLFGAARTVKRHVESIIRSTRSYP